MDVGVGERRHGAHHPARLRGAVEQHELVAAPTRVARVLAVAGLAAVGEREIGVAVRLEAVDEPVHPAPEPRHAAVVDHREPGEVRLRLVLHPHADQDQPVADARARSRRNLREVVRKAVQDVARRSPAAAQADHDVAVAGEPGKDRLARMACECPPVDREPGVGVRRRQAEGARVAVAAAQRVVPDRRVERGIETPARGLARRHRKARHRRRAVGRARGEDRRRERQHASTKAHARAARARRLIAGDAGPGRRPGRPVPPRRCPGRGMRTPSARRRREGRCRCGGGSPVRAGMV